MGERLNWMVLAKNTNATTIEPSSAFEYDLLNMTIVERVKYGEREYGINLKWSETPVFEWRLRANAPVADDPVSPADIVGLFNTVSGDYLFYDPRRYGINLKWLRDEGKFNSTPWYERVGNLFGGLVGQVMSIIKELVTASLGSSTSF